jgi:hypothetical protein
MNRILTDHRQFPDVPVEPVRTNFTSNGLLRERTLYFSASRIEYRVSRSFLYFCGFMLILAGVVWHLPFEFHTATSLTLTQWFALMLCWGGICTLIPFFYIRQLGQRTVIDLKQLTVTTLKRNRVTEESSLADLRCLQLCYAVYHHFQAYELNLCFAHGVRINLISVGYKRPALKLALKLANILRRVILDCTEENKQTQSRSSSPPEY